jgi:aldehyde:ferredoxin oxidoreductase
MGRFVVCGKSPATGLWAESNCGGYWGAELHFCGYDGLWITGKADKPVYLWLQEDKLEIRPADNCWGTDTYESQEIIKRELNIPGVHVMTIGPAGEKGVLFAGLFCDHGRTAGRTGLGAVAGSKNLKAIALKGRRKTQVAQPELFKELRSQATLALREDNIAQVSHDIGTAGVADYADYLGSMPKKYYHQGTMDNVDQVSGSTMSETILVGTKACYACPIGCGRVVDLGDGVRRKGPEYETVVGFGPNLLNDNLPEIVRLNELCDRLGMDTISASNTLGLAYHLFELGVISEQEVGFPLHWGDTQTAARLLQLTSRRAGIGEWLAQGSRRFAAHFGVEEEAVQVKGLEVPYHDPRGISGIGLVYATSPRGACHNKSDYFFVDWGQSDPAIGLEYYDRQAGAEKAANVARHQDWRSAVDSLVMCIFCNLSPEMVAELVNAANGYHYQVADLLKCGERGWNLKRVINHRLGLTRQDDRLPKALLQPLTDGPVAGYVPDIQGMLSAYYAVRGWDAETGQPQPDKLTELSLDWVLSDLVVLP